MIGNSKERLRTNKCFTTNLLSYTPCRDKFRNHNQFFMFADIAIIVIVYACAPETQTILDLVDIFCATRFNVRFTPLMCSLSSWGISILRGINRSNFIVQDLKNTFMRLVFAILGLTNFLYLIKRLQQTIPFVTMQGICRPGNFAPN